MARISYSVREVNIKQTSMDSHSEQNKSRKESHTKKSSPYLSSEIWGLCKRYERKCHEIQWMIVLHDTGWKKVNLQYVINIQEHKTSINYTKFWYI